MRGEGREECQANARSDPTDCQQLFECLAVFYGSEAKEGHGVLTYMQQCLQMDLLANGKLIEGRERRKYSQGEAANGDQRTVNRLAFKESMYRRDHSDLSSSCSRHSQSTLEISSGSPRDAKYAGDRWRSRPH